MRTTIDTLKTLKQRLGAPVFALALAAPLAFAAVASLTSAAARWDR